MGHQAADWLERPEREEEEKTQSLIDALKFKPGEVVADIGAGTGYLTRRIGPRIGPRGKVYAVEIQQEMLDLLTNKLARLGITNVVPALGTISDPKLPANSVDTIVMVDVYHEFDHPYEMAEAMCRALKAGGRMVFVEFRGEDERVPIKRVHKMTEAQVKKEMSVHPLAWKETIAVLPWQHIIIFTRKWNSRVLLQPRRAARSTREIQACCGWSRTTQPRSGPARNSIYRPGSDRRAGFLHRALMTQRADVNRDSEPNGQKCHHRAAGGAKRDGH
jgi:precorrin-6B methylase 2